MNLLEKNTITYLGFNVCQVPCAVEISKHQSHNKPHVLGGRKLVRSLAVGLWLSYIAPLEWLSLWV